jgi:hypothetical protein
MVSILVLLFDLLYSFPQQRRNLSGRAEGSGHAHPPDENVGAARGAFGTVRLTRPRVPHREGRACASLRRGIAGGLRGDTSRTLKISLAASPRHVAADIEPHGACAQPPAFGNL